MQDQENVHEFSFRRSSWKSTVAAAVPPVAVTTAVPPDFLPSNNLPLQISPASKYPKPSK